MPSPSFMARRSDLEEEAVARPRADHARNRERSRPEPDEGPADGLARAPARCRRTGEPPADLFAGAREAEGLKARRWRPSTLTPPAPEILLGRERSDGGPALPFDLALRVRHEASPVPAKTMVARSNECVRTAVVKGALSAPPKAGALRWMRAIAVDGRPNRPAPPRSARSVASRRPHERREGLRPPRLSPDARAARGRAGPPRHGSPAGDAPVRARRRGHGTDRTRPLGRPRPISRLNRQGSPPPRPAAGGRIAALRRRPAHGAGSAPPRRGRPGWSRRDGRSRRA